MAKFCSNCGKPIQQNGKFCVFCGEKITKHQDSTQSDFQEKRDKVLGKNSKQNSSRKWFSAAIVVILSLGIWFFIENLPGSANPIIEAQPTVSSSVSYPQGRVNMADVPAKIEDGKIIIPLGIVQQQKFIAFNYTANGKNVPLLAYISGAGKLVTAVSMCEPCNSVRFHIKAESLVCNSCGTTWELDNLSAISGACGKYPPDAIPSTIVGNEIQIDETIVANWKRRI